MSPSAPLRVPGTEDDPAGGTDGIGQALVATDDPSAKLDELIRAIDDPLTFEVARIHEEIQRLLLLHRDVHDGIELAADQVQDKRIDFLEAGPEVTAADIFVEVVLVFFLESPLLGAVVRTVYRGAANAATAALVASRPLKLRRLSALAGKARTRHAENVRAGRRISEARRKNREERRAAANVADESRLDRIYEELGKEQKALDERARRLIRITERVEDARPAIKLEPARLKQFFAEQEELLTASLVAGVKTGAAGGKLDMTPQPEPVAPDSVGVQLKRLAQDRLRRAEQYLALAATDTDMLWAIAQRDPVLGPACHALLCEIHDALRPGEDPLPVPDVKRAVALEFEKLIWAVLVADQFTYEQPSAPGRRLGGFGSGESVAAAGEAAHGARRASSTEAPRRMEAYFRDRFFPGTELSGRAIFASLRQLKSKFLEVSREEDPFAVISPLIPKAEPTKQVTPSTTGGP